MQLDMYVCMKMFSTLNTLYEDGQLLYFIALFIILIFLEWNKDHAIFIMAILFRKKMSFPYPKELFWNCGPIDVINIIGLGILQQQDMLTLLLSNALNLKLT